MKRARIGAFCVSIALTSSAAIAQQSGTRELVIETGVTPAGNGTTDQPGPVRHDSTRMFRDINGRWQPIETRSVEIHQLGPAEHVEVETIRRPDTSGALVVSERRVTHRIVDAAGEQLSIETYAGDEEGFVRYDGRLALHDRVRISNTMTADGDRQRIEEVEGRDPVAPRDPLRVVRRLVETTRRAGSDRWVTERQLFELDIERRLVPVMTEHEEAPPR